MKSILISAPILPGKVEAWKRDVQALQAERRDAYREAIREGGLNRLRVWHQKTPGAGDVCVALYEGPAPEQFLARVAGSNDAFCTWFRAALAEAHAIDFSQPMPPPPDMVIDEHLTPETEAAGQSVDATKGR